MRRAMERKKKKLTASFLEPDRNVDPEEDITAIKSSVRSRVGRPGRGGRGRGGGYSDEDSSEEEDEEEDEAHKRLMRAKDNEGNSPPGSVTKRQIRGSSAKGGCGLLVNRLILSIQWNPRVGGPGLCDWIIDILVLPSIQW